ncbi:hypothetical protein CNECB9_560026 [Cupriavidus necator]|uniref:Uncharacterized protein n=2 Tax=Cupriavidus necator TaxID=106590 RepID=A0A1K0JPW5_CUPNE|nr:hypothetical protein CNECB9_560026 [Cupriavidus necator]
MMTYTPEEARQVAADLLTFFPMMAQCVVTGAALDEFNAAAKAAQAECDLPATAESCGRIEQCLGLMANLFLDAPLLRRKPKEQVMVVLDCIERAGGACHAASLRSLH